MYVDDLKNSFIPSCFEEWGWDKLLGEFPRICDPLIREFYASASLKEDHIECWVRGHEFNLDIQNIDAMLGFEEKNHEGFTPFKDRMLSAKSVQLYLGEQGRKKPQHNHLSPGFEMPSTYHDVQLVSSQEVVNHQQCQSHIPHGAL